MNSWSLDLNVVEVILGGGIQSFGGNCRESQSNNLIDQEEQYRVL